MVYHSMYEVVYITRTYNVWAFRFRRPVTVYVPSRTPRTVFYIMAPLPHCSKSTGVIPRNITRACYIIARVPSRFRLVTVRILEVCHITCIMRLLARVTSGFKLKLVLVYHTISRVLLCTP